MSFLVAYDDSPLSRAAVSRAVEFASAEETDVVVVTVIPKSAAYARSNGWLADGEAFDADAVEETLASRVREVAPDAEFRTVRMGSTQPRSAIGLAIRREAKRADAEVVFVGSANAGRIVTNLASVGQNVATDVGYDVHIVRRPSQ